MPVPTTRADARVEASSSTGRGHARVWRFAHVGSLALTALLAVGQTGVVVTGLGARNDSRPGIDGTPRVFSSATIPRLRTSDAPRASRAQVPTASYSARVSKRTALIIGINRAAGSPPLRGAVRDAELLEEALLRYGFARQDVVVLKDREATHGRVVSELDALAARTPADGRAVFMFAGHTRKRAGANHFVTADGALVSAHELASRLGRVRAPVWAVFPTCYAGGYALPGIVGPGRVATFASSSRELAYELGGSGSYLLIHMVRYAMLDARAPDSVEDAFAFARASIERERPDRVPSIEDGFRGEFVLGPVTWRTVEEDAGAEAPSAEPEPAAPAPERTGPKTRSRPAATVCGAITVNCRR